MPALTVRIGSRETARYGLRARRIGEAEHPGPYQQQAPDLRTDRRARIRHVIWRLQEANASDRVHFTPSEELRTRIVQPPHGAKTAAKCIASLARRSQGVPAGRIPREVHEQRWMTCRLSFSGLHALQKAPRRLTSECDQFRAHRAPQSMDGEPCGNA